MTHLAALRARFARNEGLPFADVLTEANILDVLNEHGVKYRDRVFDPATTIWGFSLPGAQRRPQLPQCFVANHRPPGGPRHQNVLAQYGQLLQCPHALADGRPPHLDQAHGSRVADQRPPRMEMAWAFGIHCRWFARLHA